MNPCVATEKFTFGCEEHSLELPHKPRGADESMYGTEHSLPVRSTDLSSPLKPKGADESLYGSRAVYL
jgi:hypothetical protein